MISIVIPSYNSATTIERCLSSLYRQQYAGEYEIIVADSSNDNTPEIITHQFPEVKLVRFHQKTDPGTARTEGVRKAKGDLILFIDSDCEAEEGWIEKMVATHLAFLDVAAVGGAVINGNPEHDNIGWAGYIGEFREFIPQQPPGFVKHIPTLNISYKRWVFEKIGFFNPRFYPQEDLVFNYLIVKNGYKIYFDPEIRVKHTHRNTFRTFLHHQKRIGQITSQVLRILPLEGAQIVRNKWLFFGIGPAIPVIKFIRTIRVFLQKNPEILIRHPLVVIILKVGLLYWFWGFIKGVFSPELKLEEI